MKRYSLVLLLSVALLFITFAASGDGLDEFRIQRSEPFEFAEKPTVTRDGDQITVRFKAAAYSDVTIAVEDGTGRIVRHLASGVLGPNAPEPFQQNSLEQEIVWDGKDDTGVYIDDKDALTVRVSLGLKPQFERTMFWVPKRRAAAARPLFGATEEGVYVYNGGQAMDSLILYDRDGQYIRTIYPFSRDKVDDAVGLVRHTYPDGKNLPIKTNFLQNTMLTSGDNGGILDRLFEGVDADRPSTSYGAAHWAMEGKAARAIDVRAGRIAFAHLYLNRLGTDGATADLPLHGPAVFQEVPQRRGNPQEVSPYSVALSPDGEWLYLTGYHFGRIASATQDLNRLTDVRTLPVVFRLRMDGGEELEVFKGVADIERAGSGNDQFKVPSSVDVDEEGRVYVGDYMNDRVQVFDADGNHLKSINAYRPAHVHVHRQTGHIYVFSWWVRNQYENEGVERKMVEYGPLDNPEKIREVELAPQGQFSTSWGARCPIEFSVEVDSWSDPIRIWIAEPWTGANVLNRGRIRHSNVQVRELRGNRFETVHDFNDEVRERGAYVKSPTYYRQRLYVNPKTGICYLAEGDGSAIGKSFKELHELDHRTGRVRRIQIPLNAEDMTFDHNGLAYLRSINVVARYDPSQGWREVPWDYGEARRNVGYGWMSGMRRADVVSGLVLPADANWHHGGMAVSLNGNLVVSCGLNVSLSVRTTARYEHDGDTYIPELYPGRLLRGRGGSSTHHVWDRHGQVVYEDVAQGHATPYGVGIDADNNIYIMSGATRVIDGTPYFNRMTGTLMKFPAGKGRLLSRNRAEVPLPESRYPQRSIDVTSGHQGQAWVEDAEWLYGGVGFSAAGVHGCSCWNARFDLDYFARSFAPEMDRYSVAVVDRSGNLITRIGRYGNVDDGVPLIKDGGPEEPRSIGGDEVALFHAPYLATHTDHRLFIADPGNGRVLSVKLNYHATETTDLKDVPDAAE